MSYFVVLLRSILVIVCLIGVALWLRKEGVISDKDRPLFGKLVTDYALPALIFINLATGTFTVDRVCAAGIKFVSELVGLLTSWVVGRMLRLEHKQLGAFVLVCGFGSSSTLGYALIQQIYGANASALSDALVISEIGAGIPIFTLGVMIAMYFGRLSPEESGLKEAILPFFRSPIFISLVAGVAASLLHLPWQHFLLDITQRTFSIMGSSLTVLVTISIGLMLKRIHFKSVALLIVAVAALKLLLEPAVAGVASGFLRFPELEKQVLIIEAGMPSGTVAAVLAVRFGCDEATASTLVIGTYVLCLATIPAMLYFTV